MIFPADIVAHAENPKAFKELSVISFGDKQTRIDNYQVLEEMDRQKDLALERIFRLYTDEDAAGKAFSNLKGIIKMKCPSLIETENQNREKLLKEKLEDKKLISAVQNYLSGKKRVFCPGGDIFDKLNEKAASIILNQSSDGLVMAASVDSPGIRNQLTTACRRRNQKNMKDLQNVDTLR